MKIKLKVMNIKNFDEFNLIKENILNEDDDENENKWEVRIDGANESFWENHTKTLFINNGGNTQA